jgi:hypothetical protein
MLLGRCALLLAAAGFCLDHSFENTVQPVLSRTCSPCHNEQVASGGLNIAGFTKSSSLASDRAGWDRILDKMKSGEMPPAGVKRPPEIDKVLSYLQGEFDKADRNVKPDPGRVTARRLNRAEYSNTIRDLLAVDFRAEKNFPTDDLGNGFDNIGDVLTISPVLMEKYLKSAGDIARRAVGAEPLPKKPLEIQLHYKDKRIRRVEPGLIEGSTEIPFDGEYNIRIGLPGERDKEAKPVKLAFWMDGKLLHTQMAETKPSGLVYFNPYSDETMHLHIPDGEHTFRAGFLEDDFVKTLTIKEIYNNKKNKFLESITFEGPFPAKEPKASRDKIFICDVKTGDACVQTIVANLAHRAYRRPVTPAETAALMKFVRSEKDPEQGIQLALQAMLVSPHFLFRIERDPNPTDPTKVHQISEVELASRLSYFLWSSMPDDELLGLAEMGKLRASLDEQVKRMLADPKSSSLADNFAGQWLELRNLDVVKPDPQKFPDWNQDLRDAMKAETRMFFDHILRENRPLAEFLDARYTFLNDRLAKFYGIDGVTGSEFRRVDLTTPERGGLLSHASVLTVSSYPTRTSVVIRGKYILNNILNSPPPPPPPDVPALDENAVGASASLRQQMEKHREDPTCASCHNKMDSLGFGLENYDGIGKWRAKDGKFDVDATGVLPNGTKFADPAEMRAAFKSHLPQFARCMVEKMLTYSLGRGIGTGDRRTVDQITTKWAAADYPFQKLIFETVQSLPFQSRRGESVQK